MAHLYRETKPATLYTDRKYMGGKDGWSDAISASTTLYIGNLSFYTTEEQLYEFFGRAGEVKRIVMGLDRHNKTPCGFCFVEYFYRSDTENAVRYLNGLKLDERIVRVDWDGGFEEGRQYGRGHSGGQVREEYRGDFDSGRGGWGKLGDSPHGAPIPQQTQNRRRSFDNGSYNRRGPEHNAPARSYHSDRAPLPERTERSEPAPDAKRSRVEANPRFRETNDDEDDD